MKIKGAMMALAVAGGSIGSMAMAQAPAHADPSCHAVVSDLGAPGVRHASCASGATWVRVKIQCKRSNNSKYFVYGPWVYSSSIGDSSAASCERGETVVGAWAEQ